MFFTKTPDEKLLKAAKKGDVKGIENALAKGANINATANNGSTALRLATVANEIEAVRLLLESGADPNIQNISGYTPLSRAAGQGFQEILALLLADGRTALDTQDNRGDTALRTAVINRETRSVGLLLEKGANPDIQNDEGKTALTRAVAQGYNEIVKLLLESDANTGLKDHQGWAAIDYARNANNFTAAELLYQAGVEAPEQAQNVKKPEQKDAETPQTQWHITDDLEITRVARKPAIGREITDIFNFRSGRMTTLAKDLKTSAETMTDRSFSEIPDAAWIEEARDAYEAQTGTRPDWQGDQRKVQKNKGRLNLD